MFSINRTWHRDGSGNKDVIIKISFSGFNFQMEIHPFIFYKPNKYLIYVWLIKEKENVKNCVWHWCQNVCLSSSDGNWHMIITQSYPIQRYGDRHSTLSRIFEFFIQSDTRILDLIKLIIWIFYRMNMFKIFLNIFLEKNETNKL